jgi:hypothetical protein
MPAAAAPLDSASLLWTQTHASVPGGFESEIVSFESASRTLWFSGPTGIDVLDALTGVSQGFIDTTAYGGLNSVALYGGLAALAFENTSDRRLPGTIVLFDIATRAPVSGVNTITVGALGDANTFNSAASFSSRGPQDFAYYTSNGVVSIAWIIVLQKSKLHFDGDVANAAKLAKKLVHFFSIIFSRFFFHF